MIEAEGQGIMSVCLEGPCWLGDPVNDDWIGRIEEEAEGEGGQSPGMDV